MALTEDDQLRAIYAAPDDLALRAVYADFLQELADPRGEFITLQLLRLHSTPSDAAIAREHALLRKHGEQWAGGLARWFERDSHRFHAGFFAGGAVSVFTASDMETVLADPACSLVRSLAGRGPFFELLFAAAELPSLVEVDVDLSRALELAEHCPRPLTALRFHVADATPLVETPLARCAALPALREIAITAAIPEPLATWVGEAPVVERLERLVVRHEFQPSVIAAAERRGGALRELELEQVHPRRGDTGWRCLLQRDVAPGPFTRFVARPRGVTHRLEGLAPILERLPTTLRDLTIATPKPLELSANELARLGDAVNRFALDRRSLPWPLDPPRRNTDERPVLAIRLDGEPLFDAATLPAIWKLVDEELAIGMDSFNVGETWRELGKKPLDRILKWAANKRCSKIHVFRDGSPFGMRLFKDQIATWLSIPMRDATATIDWLMRFMALGKFDAMHATLVNPDVDLDIFDFEDLQLPARGGWLVYFADRHFGLLPIEHVRAAGYATYPVGDGFLLAITPTPQALTTAHLAKAARTLTAIMRAQLVARHGFDLRERAVELVEPAARALGLVPYDDPARPRSLTVRYVKPEDPFTRIEIELSPRVERPTVCTSATWYYMLGDREGRNTGTEGTIREVCDPAALDEALREVARDVLPRLLARI